MRFVPRKYLPHDVPAWVPGGTLFFITLHCAVRGREQLTLPPVAAALLDAVAHHHAGSRWFARLFLLMPDHAHALLAFPRQESMSRVVSDWKRFTARASGIEWQRGFFDHRLRGGENWELKAAYIRQNPVRKGLVTCADDWPWRFEP
jgi:putative transposase